MDMKGWDAVFAADVGVINRALAARGALVAGFDFREQGFIAQGRFGAWRIASGGSGSIIVLEVELTSGTLSGPEMPALDVGRVLVRLTVSLAMLPNPKKPGSSTLVFDFKKVGAVASDGDGVVAPREVVDSSKRLSQLQKSVLAKAVAEILVANAASISFVLATIDPLTESDIPWLAPAATKYAYETSVDGREMLAIFIATEARDISGLDARFDTSLLPPGADAGMAISPLLFMRNVFRPAIAKSFGQPDTTFSTDAKGRVTSGAFSLPAFSNSGTSYHPRITSFGADLSDSRISMAMSGDCDMRMNITMRFTASATLSAAFDPTTETLKFSRVASSFDHSMDIPWYDRALDLVGLGIGAIIFEVTTTVVGNQVADKVQANVSTSSALVHAPAVVSWVTSAGFAPTAGGLASALVLTGTLSAT